jgi:hypothetical protein
MSGPNSTSSMPSAVPDSKESQVSDFQKIRGLVFSHVNSEDKATPVYSLDLDKGSEIHVMREYPLAGESLGALEFDDTKSIEDKIRKLLSSGSDFTVVCSAGNEIMYLHFTKKGPFQVGLVESVSGHTRKRIQRSISDLDTYYDNNPD